MLEIIDIKEEARNFHPIDEISDESHYTENVNVAISLYNRALQKIEEGNEDLARLDLKRAISLYPEFYKAIILLGICVFCNGDRIGALRIFNSVKDENYRVEAMNYLDKLAQKTDRYEVTKSKHQSEAEKTIKKINFDSTSLENDLNSDIEKVSVESTLFDNTQQITPKITPKTQTEKLVIKVSESVEKSKPQKTHEKPTVSLNTKIQKMLMLSCVLILIFIVVLLAIISNLYSKSKGDGSSITVDGNNSSSVEKEISDLKSKISALESERDQFKLLADYNSAQVKYSTKNYYDVVNIVSAMDMSKLNDEQKAIIQPIYEDSLNKFSTENLYKMFDYRKSENYDEMIKVTLPVYEKNPNYARITEILFYLALGYERTDSLDNARKYYKILIDNYPDSEQTALAKTLPINK